MLGLTHTMNTKVGNEFIRGVSGGERKRVSIAETTLCPFPTGYTSNELIAHLGVHGMSQAKHRHYHITHMDVSIAETTLCRCPLQCWDNSTRGLDSSTALEFVKSRRWTDWLDRLRL
jgi:ATP-binding cassette subfamily G (WHITE) protein 2 (PDR)